MKHRIAFLFAALFVLGLSVYPLFGADVITQADSLREMAKKSIVKVDTIATALEGGSAYNLQELRSTDLGIAAFQADNIAHEIAVQVLGYYLDENGDPDRVFDGNGIFYLVHDDTLEANGGTIIAAEYSFDSDRTAADAFWVLQENPRDGILNVRHFGAVGDAAADDTAAINAAIDYAVSEGFRQVYAPAGVYRITGTIEVANMIFLGDGYSHNSTVNGPTTILKDGNFTGVVVSYDGGLRNMTVRGQSGNSGVGVQILGGRSYLENVASIDHGSHGIRVGGDTDEINSNFWRILNCYTIGNSGDGVYIHNQSTIPTLPNCNAGYVLGLDTRDNAGNGIRIGQAIDNQLYGIGAQLNGGYGVLCEQYAVGNYFSYPYVEANALGEIRTEIGANRNVFWGYRSGANSDAVDDNGTSNLNLGRTNQITGEPFIVRGQLAHEEILVTNDDIAGYFSLQQNASTGDLDLTVSGTGTQRYFNPSQVKINSGAPLKQFLTASATVNFGTVPANSTAEATVSCPGVVVANAAKYIITVGNGVGLPTGIALGGAFVSSDGVITVRVVNATSSGVAVSQQFRVLAQLVAE